MPSPIAAPMDPQTEHAAALAAFTQGMLDADGDTPEKAKERADVARWWSTIQQTQAFDEASRKTYVKCRRYARGDSGFLVDANIVGTNIDILEAFLYAKDPDVDARPAKAVEMPSLEAMIDAAMMVAEQDPAVQQQMAMAGDQAMMMAQAQAIAGVPSVDPATGAPVPPLPPDQAAELARQAVLKAIAEQNLAKIKAAYERKSRENKTFADTSELVVSRLWKDGRLKDRGRPLVRSGLTCGPGWIKASWQNRTAPSPETTTAINDMVAQVARARQLRATIQEEHAGVEQDANIAELERQLAALQAKTEMAIFRGFVVDGVAPENLLVAPGFRLADHVDAPWNAERIPMALERICQLGKLTAQQKGRIVKYMARKPEMVRGESANLQQWDSVEAAEASPFVKGDGAAGPVGSRAADGTGTMDMGEGGGAGCFGMVWEIWDRDSNSVLWLVEGLDTWLMPAWQPPATHRFYPYFGFLTSEVDGQRHPQSPVERSWKLVDEYNRIGSAEANHRRRILPKTAFNAGAFDKGEAEKLERAAVQEMVALKLTNPKQPIRDVLFPIAYAAIDPALYDRSRIIQEIERIWGVQEALGGSINTEKTATEAEIQQSGFNARTGSRRDTLEAMLGHLALYTLEVARANMTDKEVRAIAGPNAFWPTYQGAEDILLSLNIDIRGGTTGKPNTRADREAWGMALPIIQAGIQRYAALTGSLPLDLAESEKKIVRITCEVAGVAVDVDSLFPKPGMGPVAPAPGAEGGAPGEAAGGPPGAGAGMPSPSPAPAGAPADAPVPA